MACCANSPITQSFNTVMNVYTIDRSTSTSTGQPLEVLNLISSRVPVYHTNKLKYQYAATIAGYVATGQHMLVTTTELQALQHVVEISSVKYIVTSPTKPIGTKFKVLGYLYYLDLYKH